ncbi:MAG: GldG family protein [Deltaproteobacteria bacterium]|nr:GldG family protein [Deltaproteobacteria bacterium]
MLFIELLVAISIFAAIEMIMSKVGLSFDLTPEQSHSLSVQSRQVIEDIDSPLKINVFVKKEGDQEQIRTLLEPFRRQNPLVEYEIINMDRNPGLARKYDVHSYYTTVLEYKERREKTGFPWEDRIRGALTKLLEKESTVVYFMPRPGDPDFNAERGDEHGFDFAKMRLLREGYDLKNLVMGNIAKIPEQLRVLAIVGPSRDYSKREIDLIQSFIQEGGSALFFLDPVPLPNLEKLLAEYGFILPRKIILDKEGHPTEWDDYTIVIPFIDKRHAIARGLDMPGVFPLCRPVQMDTKGYTLSTKLIATGKTSWATSDAKGIRETKDFNPISDQSGPVTVGMTRKITQNNGKTARIVVYGNARFFDNTFIKLLGNGKLFVNTIQWAAEQELDTHPGQIDYGRGLFLSAKEYREIQLICVLLPMMTIITGCIIFIKRRRR